MAPNCLSRVKSMVRLLIQSLYNPKYQMTLATHLWKPAHPLTITQLPNLMIIPYDSSLSFILMQEALSISLINFNQ